MVGYTTPLALALADASGEPRTTPVDAFKLARRWWLEGRRLNLSALADELGVSRATLTRWIGSKELLLGEILWSLYSKAFENAKAEARQYGRGAEYLIRIFRDVNRVIMTSTQLKQFLHEDPQFALRILISKSGIQQRVNRAWRELLDEELAAGTISLQMDTASLACFIYRIGEVSVYSDLICGHQPALEPSETAIRLLLTPRE